MMVSLSELEIPSPANGPTVCERNSRLLTGSTTFSVSTAQIIQLKTFLSLLLLLLKFLCFFWVDIIVDTRVVVKAAGINELQIKLVQLLCHWE